MSLNVSTFYDEEKKQWISKPVGEVDVYTSNILKESLALSYSDKEKVADLEIDMTNLEYIDSTGLGVLIGALKRLKINGNQVIITNLRDNVKKIFVITGLDEIFKMEG